MVDTKISLIIFFAAKDGEALYSQRKQDCGVDCGSDHELLIAKFRLKLKKVEKTSRPFRYDLNQIWICSSITQLVCVLPGNMSNKYIKYKEFCIINWWNRWCWKARREWWYNPNINNFWKQLPLRWLRNNKGRKAVTRTKVLRFCWCILWQPAEYDWELTLRMYFERVQNA